MLNMPVFADNHVRHLVGICRREDSTRTCEGETRRRMGVSSTGARFVALKQSTSATDRGTRAAGQGLSSGVGAEKGWRANLHAKAAEAAALARSSRCRRVGCVCAFCLLCGCLCAIPQICVFAPRPLEAPCERVPACLSLHPRRTVGRTAGRLGAV